MRREAVVDDAGGLVFSRSSFRLVADFRADEAEAVVQQREALHVFSVRDGAQDGAVVDVEELDGLVVRAGEVGIRGRSELRAARAWRELGVALDFGGG